MVLVIKNKDKNPSRFPVKKEQVRTNRAEFSDFLYVLYISQPPVVSFRQTPRDFYPFMFWPKF